MTTSALGSALSGLRLAQKALDVTSSNIANASVEGYTRKTLHQESIITGGVGVGVRFGEIQRYVDQSVMRDYRTQLGSTSSLATREGYLSRIMELHGSSESETNISAQLGKLYNGFVAMSADPESSSLYGTTLAQARQVAKTFNDSHTQLVNMRNEVQTEIKAEIDELNRLLGQIAEMNIKIKGAYVVGKSTAAMEDLRDEAVKQVAQQMNVTYFTDGDGVLVLQTSQGQVLADTEARKVDFQHTLLSPVSQYPQDISGIILQLNGADTVDLTTTSPGGRLGALLDLRDRDLIGYMTQLDELAHKTMLRFEEQGLALFTDGAGIVPVNNPGSYVGVAGSIMINPVVANNPQALQQGTTGVPINIGSNEVIMNIVNYTFGRTKDAAGTPHTPFNTVALGAYHNINVSFLGDPSSSIVEFSSAVLDNQAKDYTILKKSLETENAYLQEIQTRYLDASAVNSDEELARMIELQKSYSSNAKMIGTLEELFRDLLNAI